MSRLNFYELLHKRILRPYDEIIRLRHLFVKEELYDHYGYITLKDYIDQNIFKRLNIRSTFININDLMESLEFNYIDEDCSFDKLFLFCEFLFALFFECEEFLRGNSSVAHKQGVVIIDNICNILEKTNHEFHDIGDNKHIIIEKNKKVLQAIEAIEDESVAIEAIEYNHYRLRGDLLKKRSILLSLGNYIEPLLRSNKLKNNGYADIQSDLGFLLNNFHIRHNNKEGKKAQEYILEIENSVLEIWYDRTYNIILSALIISESIEINNMLTELKTSYKWKA